LVVLEMSDARFSPASEKRTQAILPELLWPCRFSTPRERQEMTRGALKKQRLLLGLAVSALSLRRGQTRSQGELAAFCDCQRTTIQWIEKKAIAKNAETVGSRVIVNYIVGDLFEIDLPKRGFGLIYADPPYANCRFKYARGNTSRQWGRNARADYMRDLISRMEYLRAPDGICAISMSSNELRLLHLFPSKARVFAWTKPYAPFRPGVFPCYAWEPVVAWGRFCNREEQKAAKKTPHDWLQLSPRVPRKGGHETPKPIEFGDWILAVTLGPRRDNVLELFAGTAPIARSAERQGLPATAVDLVDWSDPQRELSAA
jgi:hypothetical protein